MFDICLQPRISDRMAIKKILQESSKSSVASHLPDSTPNAVVYLLRQFRGITYFIFWSSASEGAYRT